MPVYLKNAIYIDWESFEFHETDLMIEEGEQGELKSITEPITVSEGDKVIDCSGQYVIKSFGCAHHHSYSSLALGMPSPEIVSKGFIGRMEDVWWKMDKCLDLEMVKLSAQIVALNCAKNGITFVMDHHSSPSGINGSLDIIARAFESVGLSHLLCYEISDRNGIEKTEMSFEETERYLSGNQGLVGLHASFTVGTDTLKKAVDLCEKYDSGIHIHVAEDKSDQLRSLEVHNKRVVERLSEFGVLNSRKAIMAHCIHLNDAERNLVEDSNAWVVQNTISNLNNNVGMFNSIGLGNKIMLGTDGIHSDMLRAAKMAYFIGHAFDKIDLLKIYRRFRNIHKYTFINGLNGDDENNLVVLDYKPSTEFKKKNFLDHFLFGIESKHVKHVISNGKLIIEDRKVLNVDEEMILKESKRLSEKLWSRLQEQFGENNHPAD